MRHWGIWFYVQKWQWWRRLTDADRYLITTRIAPRRGGLDV